MESQPASIAPAVHSIAGPALLLGAVDHAGSHRIKFDVARAGEKLFLGLYLAGAMASFPQSSATFVFEIDVLGVAATTTFMVLDIDFALSGVARRWI